MKPKSSLIALVFCGLELACHSSYAQEPISACELVRSLKNTERDASADLSRCIAESGSSDIQLEPGVYTLSRPVLVQRRGVTLSTTGVSRNTPPCNPEKGVKCAVFLRAPTFREQSEKRKNSGRGAKSGESLFVVSGEDITFDHLELDGMKSLRENSGGSLLSIRSCTNCNFRSLDLRNSAGNSALLVVDSSNVALSGSRFSDNGTETELTSHVDVSKSSRVMIENNFLKSGSKFGISMTSCQECEVTGNVVWQPLSSKLFAIAGIRAVGKSIAVRDNYVDCDVFGCSTAFYIGKRDKQDRQKPTVVQDEPGIIELRNNTVSHALNGFRFGPGPIVALGKNAILARTGNLLCGNSLNAAFAKSSGAVIRDASGAPPGRIVEAVFSAAPIPAADRSDCTALRRRDPSSQAKTSGESLLTSVSNVVFPMILGRDASDKERGITAAFLASGASLTEVIHELSSQNEPHSPNNTSGSDAVHPRDQSLSTGTSNAAPGDDQPLTGTMSSAKARSLTSTPVLNAVTITWGYTPPSPAVINGTPAPICDISPNPKFSFTRGIRQLNTAKVKFSPGTFSPVSRPVYQAVGILQGGVMTYKDYTLTSGFPQVGNYPYSHQTFTVEADAGMSTDNILSRAASKTLEVRRVDYRILPEGGSSTASEVPITIEFSKAVTFDESGIQVTGGGVKEGTFGQDAQNRLQYRATLTRNGNSDIHVSIGQAIRVDTNCGVVPRERKTFRFDLSEFNGSRRPFPNIPTLELSASVSPPTWNLEFENGVEDFFEYKVVLVPHEITDETVSNEDLQTQIRNASWVRVVPTPSSGPTSSTTFAPPTTNTGTSDCILLTARKGLTLQSSTVYSHVEWISKCRLNGDAPQITASLVSPSVSSRTLTINYTAPSDGQDRPNKLEVKILETDSQETDGALRTRGWASSSTALQTKVIENLPNNTSTPISFRSPHGRRCVSVRVMGRYPTTDNQIRYTRPTYTSVCLR